MAKRKYETPAIAVSMESSPRHDNHSPGVGNLPTYASDPSEYNYDRTPAAPGKKVCFPAMVAKGESVNEPDVIVHTANGVSSSKGRNKGREYTRGDGDAGTWNDNDFTNGNLTGM